MEKYLGDKSKELFRGIIHHCITNTFDVIGDVTLRQNKETDNSETQKIWTLNGKLFRNILLKLFFKKLFLLHSLFNVYI